MLPKVANSKTMFVVFGCFIGLLVIVGFYILSENQRDTEYAKGWNLAGAREAIRLSPNEPAAHSAMASVWMKQKQYGKAVAEYRQAVKLEPKNPYNHLEFGDALSLCGDTAKARKEWHTAVILDVAGGQAATESMSRLNSSKAVLPSPIASP